MTAFAIVTGSLFKAPEQRTSKAGKLFVTAIVKVSKGEVFEWWRIAAFSESARTELLRLADGDAISVQGPFRAEVFEKDGEHRISLSITADQVLALRQPPKSRAAKMPAASDARSKAERQRGTWSGPTDGPNDSLDGLSF